MVVHACNYSTWEAEAEALLNLRSSEGALGNSVFKERKEGRNHIEEYHLLHWLLSPPGQRLKR